MDLMFRVASASSTVPAVCTVQSCDFCDICLHMKIRLLVPDLHSARTDRGIQQKLQKFQ